MAFALPGARTRKPAKRRRGLFVPAVLLFPVMMWLVLFFVVPTIALASQSLQTGSIYQGFQFTWAFSNYTSAISTYWSQILRSFVFAGIATVFTLAIGFPLAWFIAHRSGRFKNIVLVLVIAPFFTNFLIRTLAWQTILVDGGVVANTLNATGIMSLLRWVGLVPNDSLLGSPFAVICGLIYNFLPFMVLPLYASVERIDQRYLDAASDLYANGWSTFWRVIWPLSLPGVVAGTLLTFIPAVGDYINARILGNANTTMVGRVIESEFLTNLNYPIAAALSFILMIIIIVMVSAYVRASGTEELV